MMAETVDTMILEQLRGICASQERVERDMSSIKGCVTAIEGTIGNIHLTLASMNSRMDRFDERVARIERRLELREPA